MNIESKNKTIPNFFLEINPTDLRSRFFQILPGLLAWSSLLALAILAFIIPFWIAIFIIIFDVYILIRGAYMSVHLVYAYVRLRKMKNIDWLERCQEVSKDLAGYLSSSKKNLASSNKSDRNYKKTKWQTKQLIENLENIKRKSVDVIPWDQVHHAVILPTYDESAEVLRTSLQSFANADFPLDKIHVCVGFEERTGDYAIQRSNELKKEFEHLFGSFITTFHPDGLRNEKRVKSANAAWAMKKLEIRLAELSINVDDILVSNFDSDTVVNSDYFAHLTYAFITHHDRYHVSYQPLPMYNNNLWDAPAFSRVIATGSTFWQMIESTRPERLVTFSSHSMTLRALKDVDYWQKDIVSEDSRIFWQCLLRYDGHYRTEPLYTAVSMDAALSDSWWQTLKNQYKQKRRWAWGIENFPYLMEGFIKNKKIPFSTKFTYAVRTLEGHYSWATAPIIVAGLGWLPIFFGGPNFHSTVLSYSLPFTARTIMSIAMLGLLISTALSLLLLPDKPAKHSKWRYLPMSLQWVLFPVIATILSAFPALDAETRLLLGRDLQFNVTEKSRAKDPDNKKAHNPHPA